MPVITDSRTQQHQVEMELWLKELSFLNDEIEIMKHHLSDVYYRDHPPNVAELVEHFDETFRIQQQWLHKMKEDIENTAEDDKDELEWFPQKKSFHLQMQANRLINQELKDNFLELFS